MAFPQLKHHWRFKSIDYWQWLVPIIFFSVTYVVMPIGEVFQFDSDEGLELAKVRLVSQGYPLYSQIWNDQPPLMTWLLSHWLQLFGKTNMVAARCLTLLFATLLVGCFYRLLRRDLSLKCSLVGVIALCLSFNFLRLSVSVMRGLPAIALALLSLVLLLQPHTRAPRPAANITTALKFVSSAICFGLSLQIKLFTILLLPSYTLYLLLGHTSSDWRSRLNWRSLKRRIPPVITWLILISLTALSLGLATHSLQLDQLLGGHFNPQIRAAMLKESSWQLILLFLIQDSDYSILAIGGIAAAWRLAPQQFNILPSVWLLTVLFACTFHRPLWYHYYPLIAIPIVWLATYSLTTAELTNQLPLIRPRQLGHWLKTHWQTGAWRSRTVAVGLIAVLCLTPVKLTWLAVQNHLYVTDSRTKLALIPQLQQYPSQWLFTDLPVTSFYAGINALPEIAVFSSKRRANGELSPERIIELLEQYQPQQILLGRYALLELSLQSYLDTHYQLVNRTHLPPSPIVFYTQNVISHYIRQNPDLKGNST